MKTKITIEHVNVPKPLSRQERRQIQFDTLMDKAEYATDMFLAGRNKEAALECLRKLYNWFDGMPNGVPEHLKPIYDMIAPTIEQYGRSDTPTQDEEEQCHE